MRILALGICGAAMLVAVPAQAGDRLAYRAIAAGDLASAEKTLTAERRIFPSRPELMLNLAAVYDRTGRSADARALYAEVLNAEPVELALSGGVTASSHQLASTGLARLGRAIAAR